MKNFLILHYGFEQPTEDDMKVWEQWFRSIADRKIDQGGLRAGREITNSGITDLPFGKDSLTGYTLIEADSLNEAESIAGECPVVTSTQVYEIHR